jgi:N-acylglucosamine-6-phosphate 2-epimerase
MDRDDMVLAMAQASEAGGAVAVRVEGFRRLALVAAALRIPVIGIVKSQLPDSPVRTTPRRSDVRYLADAGAWMIATTSCNTRCLNRWA